MCMNKTDHKESILKLNKINDLLINILKKHLDKFYQKLRKKKRQSI